VLGAAGLADSAAVLLIGGGANTGTLLPGIAGALLCIWSVARAKEWPIAVSVHWRRERYILYLGTTLFALSFVIVQGFIWTTTLRQPGKEQQDWLIVLGAGLRGGDLSLTLRRRMDTALDFLESQPKCRVIVSGGRGFGETRTEAEAMTDYLVKRGMDRSRIFREDKATSTMENLRLSKIILQHEGGPPPWKAAVVTSDFHLLRVRMLAERVGLELRPLPAPTPWYLLPNACLREYFAVIKSAVLDRG
jgi:uncharacterized SAM-binding protein YcdF (DUF218 family)